MNDAMDPRANPAAVTEALKLEGLNVQATEQSMIWEASFEIHAVPQPVLLFLPPDGEYFLAVSMIPSTLLEGRVDELSVQKLRAILKVQNETLLAKLYYLYIGDQIVYTAMSPCSKYGWDGPKLRKRMRASAELAAGMTAALLSLPAI